MTITGKKVILRPIETSDLEILREIQNDMMIQILSTENKFPISSFQQQAWFSSQNSANQTNLRLVIAEPSSSKAIGMTGLWNIDSLNHNASTGLKILPSEFRGKGFGFDTLMTILAYGFSRIGLHRIETTILENNTPSLKLFTKKCGFTIEGTLREKYRWNQEYLHVKILSLLDENYYSLSQSKDYINLVCPHPQQG